MKKLAALLLCLSLLTGAYAVAEDAPLTLGTIGNAKAAYGVSCTVPDQYAVFHTQADNQSLEGMLANSNPKKASYLFVVMVEEDYAGIESLGALDEQALKAFTDVLEEDGLKAAVKEKNGEKYVWLSETGAKKNTYAMVETVIHGCLIQITLSPVEEVVSAMTEKEAQAAMDFLATLAFTPADPFPADETEDAEPEEEAAIKETVQEPDEKEQPAETAPIIVGGWTVNNEYNVTRLTEKEQQVFDQAAAQTGMDYEPITVLATQVVAGTNYAYLCQERDGDREWIIVTVYSSFNGDVQVLNAHVLALYNLLTTDKPLPAGLAGGWTLHKPDNSLPLPEKARAAFNQAVKAAEENLSPIALLGTQLVSGMNYKVLAQGESGLYLVTVYAPLTGDASITSLEILDLLSYVSIN
ncbi:MAG: hypothetical protein IKH57_07900 [Clostridia bacterium]|nr:hypothetical protein [Clostridia bacterium]